MAINNNRIRCTASINGFGVINVDTAIAGYRVPTDLWAGGTMASGTIGTHQYILEDDTGGWELGVVVTTGTYTSTRTVIHSNMNSGAGFANDATGLTLSIVGDDLSAWACHRQNLTDNAPLASGSGLAAGANAVAADCSVAIGKTTLAKGAYATAMGENAGSPTAYDNATSLGALANAAALGATALGVGATAVLPSEVCLGEYAVSHVPVSGTHTGSASAVAAGGAAVDFRDFTGYFMVQATIRIEDDANPDTLAYTKAFSANYFLYSDGATCTTLGTPTITTVYTGGSVGTSALTIDATTGAPKLTYSGASGTGNSKGLLTISKA